jgi:hypothetical protein
MALRITEQVLDAIGVKDGAIGSRPRERSVERQSAPSDCEVARSAAVWHAVDRERLLEESLMKEEKRYEKVKMQRLGWSV